MSENKTLNNQLYDAVAALAKANDRLVQANRRWAEANNEQCAALNAVNEQQREFDKLVDQVKSSAAPDTEWQRKARQGRAVEAG